MHNQQNVTINKFSFAQFESISFYRWQKSVFDRELEKSMTRFHLKNHFTYELFAGLNFEKENLCLRRC
jgi:hypothetical protein